MKKFIALLLALSLVFCMPMGVFAAEMADAADGAAADTAADTTTPDTTAPAAKDLSAAQIATDKTSYTYTGSEIKPAVTVTLGTETVPATGYDVTYGENVNAGTMAVITIQGKGDYTGEQTVTFTIDAKEFKGSDMPSVEIPTQKKGTDNNTLSGLAVTWGSVELKAGTDFDVTCDNSRAGTQKATITFKGNFTGSVSKNYDVVENSISEAGIYLSDLNAAYTFTGKAHKPEVSVRIGTKVLAEGSDYKVSYADNVNAGTAKIVVTGMGAYSGTIEKEFSIAKAKLSDCTVTFNPGAYTATGEAITPAYKILLGDYELTKDKDYTATFSDNVKVGDAKAEFKAAGGNFSGSRSEKFQIVSKAISDLGASLSTTIVSYTGKAQEPAVEIKDGTTVLVAGSDYTVKYEDNVNAGTAKAIVTGQDKYAGTLTLEFTIKGKDNKVTTDYTRYTRYLTSKDWNLNAKGYGDEAGLTYISSNEEVATVSADGTVSIVGTGRATITVKTFGTKEYNPAEKVVTVTVKPKTPVVKLTTPAKKQVKVTITKVEGATKYQVRYGRNGKYYYKTIKHLDNQYLKTSTTLKNRISGKTYYVKVRAITVMEDGTAVYGNWSATKKIKAR